MGRKKKEENVTINQEQELIRGVTYDPEPLEQDVDEVAELEKLEDAFYDPTKTQVDLDGLATISKEVKSSMANVSDEQIRIIIDSYYQTQKNRIALENQIRAVKQGYDNTNDDENLAIDWLAADYRNRENQIKKMIDEYVKNIPVCQWAKSIKGIGPIFAANLYSYIDMDVCKHANQFLNYAGLNDNNIPWLGREKGIALANEAFDIQAFINEHMEEYESGMTPYEIWLAHDPENEVLEEVSEVDEEEVEEYSDIDKPEVCNEPCLDDNEEYDFAPEEFIDSEEEIVPHFRGTEEDFLKDIKGMASPKSKITDTILMYVAEKSGRKFETVMKGFNSHKAKLNSQKEGDVARDKSDKTILAAYLAKPPYNTDLKTMCYLIGHAFVLVSNRGSLYGEIYRSRKAYETIQNNNLAYKDQAERILKEKNWNKNTPTYKCLIAGKLSPAHIDQRAQRYATKIFLTHFFEACWIDKYHTAPPVIYPIAFQGHVDYIKPEVPFSDFLKITSKEEQKIKDQCKSEVDRKTEEISILTDGGYMTKSEVDFENTKRLMSQKYNRFTNL